MQFSSILVAALVANGVLASPLKQGGKSNDHSASSSDVSATDSGTGTATAGGNEPTSTGGGKGGKKHHQTSKLNPSATNTGSGAQPTGSGTTQLDSKQQKNADAILKQLKTENLGSNEDKACWAVFATALQESQIYVYANPTVPGSMQLPHDKVGGDQDSVGIFQQRIADYPDLKADMDPAQSAGQFIKQLKAVPNWQTMETSDLCQTVQKAQAGNLYGDNVTQAKQICKSGGGSGSSTGTDTATATGTAGTGTATADPAPTSTGHKKAHNSKGHNSKTQTRTQSTDTTLPTPPLPADSQ